MAPSIFSSPLPKLLCSGWGSSQLNKAVLGILDGICKKETCFDIPLPFTLPVFQWNWAGPLYYSHLSLSVNMEPYICIFQTPLIAVTN